MEKEKEISLQISGFTEFLSKTEYKYIIPNFDKIENLRNLVERLILVVDVKFKENICFIDIERKIKNYKTCKQRDVCVFRNYCKTFK